jgi:hypothetical protein
VALLVGCGSTPAPTTTEVLAKLTAAGLPVVSPVTQTAVTDPNHLLGRPGQYTARASFGIPDASASADADSVDHGGVVEIWPSAASAGDRAARIRALLSGGGLGAEYDFQADRVLLRISGALLPSEAAKYGKAVSG